MPKASQNIEPIYLEIGARMRWLREQRGWSCADLGRTVDVHPSTIAAWENAIARVGVADLVRIAHGCGADMVVFLADLDVEKCQPPAGLREKRKEVARKRVEAMKASGSFEKRSAMMRKKRGKANG